MDNDIVMENLSDQIEKGFHNTTVVQHEFYYEGLRIKIGRAVISYEEEGIDQTFLGGREDETP